MATYSTTCGPYSNGYWLIDNSHYTSQSGFTYLFLNVSTPVMPLYWLGRMVISSSGSISYYVDTSSNIQISYHTTGGSFIQVGKNTTKYTFATVIMMTMSMNPSSSWIMYRTMNILCFSNGHISKMVNSIIHYSMSFYWL